MNPRIQHHLIDKPTLISDFLRENGHSSQKIQYLLEMGAIYVNGLRHRMDIDLKQNDQIRVHLEPKRFSIPNWQPLIIFENEELLVIDKPTGLPTHPTLDNYVENTKILCEKILKRTLYVTHRLDVATQGVLILAKSLPAQQLINKIFSKRRVQKIYHAHVERPIAEGIYVHYMDLKCKAPKKLFAEPGPGLVLCSLGVRHTDNDRILQIELHTGRTHQIRAQMSFLGAPVVGDTLYGAQPSEDQNLQLECFSMSFRFRLEDIHLQRPQSLFARTN